MVFQNDIRFFSAIIAVNVSMFHGLEESGGDAVPLRISLFIASC